MGDVGAGIWPWLVRAFPFPRWLLRQLADSVRRLPGCGWWPGGAAWWLAASVPGLFAGPVLAQDPGAGFPSRSLRIVIPFPPSGLPDVIARMVAPRLAEALGQPVLVDNRAGASGAIALKYLVEAPADGHTLGMVTSGSLTVEDRSYNFARDFVAVSQLASNAYVLVVSSKVPARNLAELLAVSRARPGTLSYGSSGAGGATHLAMEWLASLASVQWVHVPYKGIAQALTDVAGGHTGMAMSSVQLWRNFAGSGQVLGMAVTSPVRQASAAELPTIQEAGVPGYEIEGWYGIIASARTPAPVVERLSQDFVRIMKQPDLRQKLTADGANAVGTPAAQFAAYLRSETQKWRRIEQQAGLSAAK